MDKRLDQKGRWRSKIVAFRMSEGESEELNTKVSLSGLSKQDYIIKRLLCKDIIVQGNPRVHKALRNRMEDIYQELKRIEKLDTKNQELLSSIELLAITMDGMKKEARRNNEEDI